MSLSTDSLVLCRGSARACSLTEFAGAASAAGFDGVSLYFDDVVDDPQGARSLFDDHGLEIAEIDGAMRWMPSELRGPEVSTMLDVAATLGARSVNVIETAGDRAASGRDRNATAEAFGAVCDYGATLGLLAHIEFFPFSGIPSLTDAAHIVHLAGRANGGVLLDTWHLHRGPDRGRWPRSVPAAVVIAIQLGDAAPGEPDDLRHEMMHGRLVPGSGDESSMRLLVDLRADGCTAPIGVEVYSDDLAVRPPVEVARLLRGAVDHVRGTSD